MLNYYDILGVSSSATQEEIKAAYKAKAKEYHPDRNFGDPHKEEVFKQVNEAYSTLSNSYTRSKYDMLLRYGHSQSSAYGTTYERPRPRPHQAYRRQPVSVTSKENLKATGYAFLFAFIIAVIIKTSIFIYQEYREAEMEELLTQRRAIFHQIQSKKQSGELVESLELLADMGSFYSAERDMSYYKENLLTEIKDKGDEYLEAGEYAKALDMYDALKEYAYGHSRAYMKKLAFTYKGMGRIKDAIDIYRTLHLYGYESMDFYYEMGQLYEEGVNDHVQALKYYKICAEKAAASYEITIGRAYPIIINAALIPEQHYHIYMKVAQMHLVTGEYDKAIEAVEWSQEIWPDSTYQYHIRALALQQLGKNAESKAVIKTAKAHDPDFELESMEEIVLMSSK
ncbi:J domain-containing protein [Reichenbachiella ulvae]|uniref:DnaJ domain-containing protein n=1 Tax=Reichenbachiella ulvae TaxID=2980104 RepID=A0ABT3CZ83_9BACT|nr:DnaJ domain-containing protein [Reichenbachiella ulvae]MCV9388889.1 DnaJ domain-containing protein [Reichenbachiella ulvae]